MKNTKLILKLNPPVLMDDILIMSWQTGPNVGRKAPIH